MSKWISVEEQLPPNGTDVLCWYRCYSDRLFSKRFENYGVGCCFNGVWGGAVMHGILPRVIAWMPLPKPPKYANKQTNQQTNKQTKE